MASWEGVEAEFVTRWSIERGMNETLPVARGLGAVMGDVFTEVAGQEDANVIPEPNALVVWAHLHPDTFARLEAMPEVVVLWAEDAPFWMPDDALLAFLARYEYETGDAGVHPLYPPTRVSLDSDKTKEELDAFGLTAEALALVEERIAAGLWFNDDGKLVHLELEPIRERVRGWERDKAAVTRAPGASLDVAEKPKDVVPSVAERASLTTRLLAMGLHGTYLAGALTAQNSRGKAAEALKEVCKKFPKAKVQ